MKVVFYRRHDDMDVEFLDDYHFIKKHVTYSNFKRGEIKNPYDNVFMALEQLVVENIKLK